MLGFPMGMGMAPELHPDVQWGIWKKFQMTNFDMPNDVPSMALLILGSEMAVGYSDSNVFLLRYFHLMNVICKPKIAHFF